jgi:drug/metabolite transporter (DMT)-like permease
MLKILFSGFALLASGISTNKVLLDFITPAFFVALRMLFSGTILVIYKGISSPRLRGHYIKPDFIKLCSIAALTTFIPSYLKAYGLKNLISSKAAFLGSLDPFITAFLAFILHKERLSLRKLAGIFLGIVGVSILFFSSTRVEESLRAFSIFSYPELAYLAAVIISRFGWMEAQKLLKIERYTPSELNGILMVIGGLYALITTFYTTSSFSFCIPLTSSFIGLFLYTVIFGNICGYTLYGRALKYYSATFVSLAGLSVPLFVHILGWLFLGESLSLTFFIALGVTFVGLFIFYQDKN